MNRKRNIFIKKRGKASIMFYYTFLRMVFYVTNKHSEGFSKEFLSGSPLEQLKVKIGYQQGEIDIKCRCACELHNCTTL